MYAVVQDELGNTTDIDDSAENVYITRAGPATDPPFTLSVGGNGTLQQYTGANGMTVSYENRPIQRGQNYYFFVRLYSCLVGDEREREGEREGVERNGINVLFPLQNQTTFNDSNPQKPSS